MATSQVSESVRPSESSSSSTASVPSPSPAAAGACRYRPYLKHPLFARPRVPFCWVCSERLDGWIHRTCLVDGNEVVTHCTCAREEGLTIKPGDRLSVRLAKRARMKTHQESIIQAACRGDRRAIGAVSSAFGPLLHAAARAILGDLGDRGRRADLVLDDFFDSLVKAETELPPASGRGLEWMKGVVRAMARAELAKGGSR